MADRYTKAEANQIKNRSLKQIELDITNTPSDGQILKVNMPLGDFTAIDAPSVVVLAASVAVNQTNIVLNAFRIAIDASRSIFNMVDGIVDYFNDETGIDTGASTNEDYDAANDLYSPTNVLANPATVGANTKLLIDFDGADGATSHTATTGQSVTFVGNAQLDTADKQFGSASLLLDGTGDNVTIPDSADWDFGTGDFTIDFWIKWNANLNTQRGICGQVVDGNNFWALYNFNDGNIYFSANSPSVGSFAASISPLSTGTWYHIAFVRNGSASIFFFDGIAQSTSTFVAWGTMPNLSAVLTVGKGDINTSLGSIDGWIDDFRITKGEALWTENFDTLLNMTLISDTFTAEAEPDDARIVVLLEDVDAITINTDLIAKISRDGGSNYSTVTLSDDGNFDASKRILTGSVDISGQPSGTSMEYSIETANNKDLKIHSAALNWE